MGRNMELRYFFKDFHNVVIYLPDLRLLLRHEETCEERKISQALARCMSFFMREEYVKVVHGAIKYFGRYGDRR